LLETVPTLAFSVQHGLRQKFSGNNGVYTLLKPNESKYITDIEEMLHILLPQQRDKLARFRFKSTSGICGLLASYYPEEYRLTVARGFVRSLWHGMSQRLCKDWQEDRKIKLHAITTVYGLLNLPLDDFSDMIQNYYRKEINFQTWNDKV
jgi:hypothetical protein